MNEKNGTPFIGQQCRVVSYGFGKVIDVRSNEPGLPGVWVLVQFDPGNRHESSWFLSTIGIEFDERPDREQATVDEIAQNEGRKMNELATSILQMLSRRYEPGQVLAEGRILYEINQAYGRGTFSRELVCHAIEDLVLERYLERSPVLPDVKILRLFRTDADGRGPQEKGTNVAGVIIPASNSH